MFDILYTRLKSPKVQGRDLVRLGTTGAMAPADIFQRVVNTHSNSTALGFEHSKLTYFLVQNKSINKKT